MTGRRVAALGAALGALALIAGGASSCEGDRSLADLPQSKVHQIQPEVLVYVSPDLFPNLVTYCVIGEPARRAFLTTREQAPVILVEDKGCEGNATNEAPPAIGRAEGTVPAAPFDFGGRREP